MTTPPTPPTPAPTPQPGPPSADPGQQPPTQGAPPATPPTPPVPQPPTWTPPPPAPVDDGGIDDISKLPKKWQKELTDARGDAAKYRARARTETVLRHAYTTASQHGANGDALLGSVAFANVAANLDPNAEDFPAKLAEAIQGALAANPWMAAQQAATPPPPPAQSGADFSGGAGTGQAPKNLADQIREAETKGDWKTARQLKTQLMLANQ